MSTRKGLRRVDDGILAGTPADNTTQSPPGEDTPPAWFLSEMKKGFTKIHDMVEDRLSKINKVVEKIHSEHSAINKKLADLLAKQTEYEATVVDLRADIADHKKETDAAIEELRGKLDDMENGARRNNAWWAFPKELKAVMV